MKKNQTNLKWLIFANVRKNFAPLIVQLSTFANHSQHFSDVQNKLNPHKFSDLVYLFMSDMHGNYQEQVNLRE